MTARRNMPSPGHVFLITNGFRCSHCGATCLPTMPSPVDVFVAAGKAFSKLHRGCPKPVPKPGPEFTTVEAWRAGWDTGLSSLAIYTHMKGGIPRHDTHPRDPDDFGRCYRLLKIAPEWRARIAEVGAHGLAWEAIATHWDELERLYEEELPTKVAPKLYALMQVLLAPAEARVS